MKEAELKLHEFNVEAAAECETLEATNNERIATIKRMCGRAGG